VKIVVAGAK